MRQIEDVLNALTDKDWSWWPLVVLRPHKDRDIDNTIVLRLTLCFGPLTGLLALSAAVVAGVGKVTAASLAVFIAFGCLSFFVIYKLTFAYVWNRRARRLREDRCEVELLRPVPEAGMGTQLP